MQVTQGVEDDPLARSAECNPMREDSMKARWFNTQLSLAALAVSLSMSAAANAQSSADATDENEAETRTGQLGALSNSIVVTARKREESAQDAPLAISAFSGESLEVRGATSIADVGNITPNVNYQNNPVAGGSSSVATVYIRGIGQRDFLGTIDNGVGFYIDDVIVARTVGAIVDLVDVERVEVLRGPQGTLFGRNNVGGAISIHSRAPDDRLGGYVEGQYGTDNLFKIKGRVDLPISDNVRTAISGLYHRQDGYVERPAGGDLGNKETYALRGAMQIDAGDSVTVDLSVDWSKDDDNGPAFTLLDAGTLAPGGFPGFYNNVLNPDDCAYPAGITSTNPTCYNAQWESSTQNFGTAPTFSKAETFSAIGKITFDISNDVRLRSITGYRELQSQFARDADASPNTLVHFFDDFETEQFSQEFQLNAKLFDGSVDWVSGLYYFKESGSNLNLLEFAIAQFQSGADFETESKAVYSQATIHLTDRLDLTLGGRWTDEDKTFDPDQIVGPNFIGIPYVDAAGDCVLQNEPDNVANGTPGLIVSVPAAACPVRLLPAGENSRQTQDFTPMVNLSYQATPDLLVYGTYSEGFRSGGFVQRVFPPLPVVPDFGPEFVSSFEAGAKFSDGSVLFNIAAFYTDYTDIQVRTERPGFVGELEDNIGDAELYGFELETRFEPVESIFLEFSAGYTHAEYTAIRVEAPLASTVTLDDSFDHVPEWSLGGAVSKEFLFDDYSSLVVRLDGSYKTEYANDPDNSALIFTPDVFLANATVRWTSSDEGLVLGAGVKNLTNEKYLMSGYLNEAIGHAEAIYNRGRQWYVQAKVNF